MASSSWEPVHSELRESRCATEHATVPGVATEPTEISTLATLCPGCHNHPSLRLPWAYLPEKVAPDIERLIDQLHSLYHKQQNRPALVRQVIRACVQLLATNLLHTADVAALSTSVDQLPQRQDEHWIRANRMHSMYEDDAAAVD